MGLFGTQEVILGSLSLNALQALYKIAKHPKKGAYPFFRNPKAMIALREELIRREEDC